MTNEQKYIVDIPILVVCTTVVLVVVVVVVVGYPLFLILFNHFKSFFITFQIKKLFL